MTHDGGFPPIDAVAQYGNLLLSYWAPPPNSESAGRSRSNLLKAFLAEAVELLVLGGRTNSNAISDLATMDKPLLALLRSLGADSRSPLLRTLPGSAAQEHFPAFLLGHFSLRRRIELPSGLNKIQSISLGTPLQLHRPSGIAEAVRSSTVEHPTEVALNLSVNPYAGFRQNEARVLRSLVDADPERMIVLWNTVHSICVLGKEPALTALRSTLLGILRGRGPHSDA